LPAAATAVAVAVQVLARRDWRCPCCRDICNCSGQNCQRSRRGLKDTKMLWHEARNLGYKSVRATQLRIVTAIDNY
jgi:hypothetical protein